MQVNTNKKALIYLLQRNRYYKKLSEAVELAGKYKKNNKVYFFSFHDLKTGKKHILNGDEIIYAVKGLNLIQSDKICVPKELLLYKITKKDKEEYKQYLRINRIVFINFYYAYQEAKFLSHVLNKIEQLRRDVQTGKIRTLKYPNTNCECKYYFKIPKNLYSRFPYVVDKSGAYNVSDILSNVTKYCIF